MQTGKPFRWRDACDLTSRTSEHLRALADFIISDDGETATVAGEMEVEIVRPTDDQLCVTVTFPSDETLTMRFMRTQLLQELSVTEP